MSDKGRNLDMEPAACLRAFSFLITTFQVNLEEVCDDATFTLLIIKLSLSKSGKVIIAIRMHFLLHFVYGLKLRTIIFYFFLTRSKKKSMLSCV